MKVQLGRKVIRTKKEYTFNFIKNITHIEIQKYKKETLRIISIVSQFNLITHF
jgi:hypothetical protein